MKDPSDGDQTPVPAAERWTDLKFGSDDMIDPRKSCCNLVGLAERLNTRSQLIMKEAGEVNYFYCTTDKFEP